LVHIQSLTRAEDGENNRQSHGGFGRCHHHHEEYENLSAHLVPMTGKGNERKVHRIEHQLNRHENGDDVALDEERRHANGEQNRAEDQVPGQWNHGRSLRASTTAPMMAIRTSTDVTSNGSRNSRKSAMPRSWVGT